MNEGIKDILDTMHSTQVRTHGDKQARTAEEPRRVVVTRPEREDSLD